MTHPSPDLSQEASQQLPEDGPPEHDANAPIASKEAEEQLDNAIADAFTSNDPLSIWIAVRVYVSECVRKVERERDGAVAWWRRGAAKLRAEIASLKADRDRLAEALKPFAAFAGASTVPDDTIITQQYRDGSPLVYDGFTMGDFRRAREALTPTNPGPQSEGGQN